MVALDLWTQPLPMIALTVSVFVANLRYFVMGAALQPHLPHLPWCLQPPAWYVTVDQNWAANIAEYRLGHGDLGKFLGGLLGHLAAGGVLADPTAARRLGLDFAGVAVFVVVATMLFVASAIAPRAVAIEPGSTMHLAPRCGLRRHCAARPDGAYIVGAVAAPVVTRIAGGFTPGLFAAIGAVALARWANLQ